MEALLVLDLPEAYAKEALEYKKRGFNAYKLHPPGKYDFDLEAHKKSTRSSW